MNKTIERCLKAAEINGDEPIILTKKEVAALYINLVHQHLTHDYLHEEALTAMTKISIALRLSDYD